MQPDPVVLVAVLTLPFAGAAVVPVVHRLLGERTAYFAAAIAAVSFLLLTTQTDAALSAQTDSGAVVIPWFSNPLIGQVALALYLDGLALLIGFLATGVGVLVFLYSRGYMHGEPGQARYYATMLGFMGSMVGVALAADLVALFLFWELTSISSFLLIGHYSRTTDGRYAARKSLIVTVSGGLFMLVGFLLLVFATGTSGGLGRTFAIAGTEGALLANTGAVRTALSDAGLFLPVLVLVVIGAAAKSAQVPLHVWLPDAMAAPTPVSAFLHAATMVKAGVYLVGRMRPLFLPESGIGADWTLVLATLGLVSMTITAMLAVGAIDIKKLLAYSTASHLGLIIAGFGFASETGAETGAFHILNHALFKAALFLVAGIVAHEVGTRAIHELGGLWRDLPVTAGVAGVTALGMAGVPPFNGFYSKELLFETTWTVATANGGLYYLYPALAVVGSVFTFLYSIRFLALFLGDKPDPISDRRIGTPPWSMVGPAALLGVLAAGVGIGGVLATVGVHVTQLEAFVGGVAGSVGGESGGFGYHLPTAITPYGLMSGVVIGVGLVAFPYYDRFHRGIRAASAVHFTSPDWYYDAGTARLERLSATVLSGLQTGVLRISVGVVLGSTAVAVLAGFLTAGALETLPAATADGMTIPLALVLLVAVVGALAVGVAPSHVAGVLTLSILGFMIAIFFILANAPDLALTQLVIETLVLVIFLLVLDKLPAFYGVADRRRVAIDGVLSVVVGGTVFLTVLLATAATPHDPIFQFFVDRAGVPAEHGSVLLDWGGGGNIVNVILVDFRAFDTLGEIAVIAMAALSVLVLIGMRARGDSPGTDQDGGGDG